MSRKAFEITQTEMDELIALNQPGAGYSMNINLETGITIHETKTAAQLVTEWWIAAGDRYGVDGRTVKHRGGLSFDAEGKE